MNRFQIFFIKARIKNEKVSKPLLKKITCEEVKLVSVDVSHDDEAKTLIRTFFGM